ncbi:MAG: hypothetical protein GY696_14435 [Gammaproteobacteria bacterium]|nr:hypothetical protein [Gammaproteobacteria bacterium]
MATPSSTPHPTWEAPLSLIPIFNVRDPLPSHGNGGSESLTPSPNGKTSISYICRSEILPHEMELTQPSKLTHTPDGNGTWTCTPPWDTKANDYSIQRRTLKT